MIDKDSINRIADREYPLVFVVQPDSPQYKFIDILHSRDMSEEDKHELAIQEDIISLDCQDVLNHLVEEMDPTDASNLKKEMKKISAARRVLTDKSIDSIKAELELDKLLTSHGLPAWLRDDDPQLFTIPPTARVLEFIEQAGYQAEKVDAHGHEVGL